jgi:hypothetical protein
MVNVLNLMQVTGYCIPYKFSVRKGKTSLHHSHTVN